jgi:hypothetical protein
MDDLAVSITLFSSLYASDYSFLGYLLVISLSNHLSGLALDYWKCTYVWGAIIQYIRCSIARLHSLVLCIPYLGVILRVNPLSGSVARTFSGRQEPNIVQVQFNEE